ncbi:hypothetical protein BJ912DRAFT_926918 [Pholiota molesta]|nr:hypothetical protein BJ912DRAFT_926918 [Pholiota molesta]
MSALGIPVDVETSYINSDLNSVIFLIFLMVYFETIYVYCTKNPSKYQPVPAAITVLYLVGILYTAVQWFSTKLQFVDNGETRDSVFLAINSAPPWVPITLNVSACITFAIADGLLIWRCFHVWNHSLRIILLSLVFLITEIALFLVQISFEAKFTNSTISVTLAARLNAVTSAAYFMSFGTTLVTTALIAYRIYSVSKQQGVSSKRLKHVIDIVVQSGAVYALSQLTAALAGVVPGSTLLINTRNIAFQDFALIVNVAVAGISSTIMVARVAMLSADTTFSSTSVHLSGLQFQAHSTQPTVNMEAMEITHSVDCENTSAGEGQAVEDKVQ